MLFSPRVAACGNTTVVYSQMEAVHSSPACCRNKAPKPDFDMKLTVTTVNHLSPGLHITIVYAEDESQKGILHIHPSIYHINRLLIVTLATV